MEVKNPGLAFNKAVFKNLNTTDRAQFRNATKSLHKKLFELKLDETGFNSLDLSEVFNDDDRFDSLELTVAWPGLMMGLGYGHGAKTEANNKDHPFMTEIKTGFYFDFTTGIPVLPGSTVKGILRSYFPGRYPKDSEIRKAVECRMIDILNSMEVGSGAVWDLKRIEALENTVFEGKDGKQSIPSTEQDIFLDAYPSKGTEAKVFETNQPQIHDGLFMGEDVLTPHHHPLRDPVPLKHLKILPGVTMRFQFLLNDLGGLSAADKKKLFTYLLHEFGAGARKGTGFGQFEQVKPTNPFTDIWYIGFTDLDTMGWDNKLQPDSQGDHKSSQDSSRAERPHNPLLQVGSEPADFKGRIRNGVQLQAGFTQGLDAWVTINGERLNVKLSREISILLSGDIFLAKVAEMGKGGVITKVSFDKKLSR